MSLIDLIRERKSIRHFTDEMPARDVILECLDAASWAPNPTSQQPWKFIVLTGDSLKKVTRVIEENYLIAAASREGQPSPALPDELAERKKQTFNDMMSFLEDKGADMKEIGAGNFNFHRAPVGIIFATYPCKDQNFLKSTVAAMENFLLAAVSKGLGTCWMNAVSICREQIRDALALSSELILVDGIAVGYPVEDSPVNLLPRSRLPVTKVTEWL